MKQYKKNFEIKNTAKDKMEGKYGGAILVFLLNQMITWAVAYFITSLKVTTLNSVYNMSNSVNVTQGVSLLFEGLLLAANILLGVMNAGVALYFLRIACGQQPFTRDLFYGFKNDSKKALVISAVITLSNTICLGPGQYLRNLFFNTRDVKWIMPALIATLIGTCIYIPISLGFSVSFFLMLDFPESSGKEILQRCWRLMKGNRKRLFLLELGFLPLILLCVLSFGIGLLWLWPYMQMTYTYFFLDLMNPKEV